MQTKTLLILSFISISLIPTSVLSAISFISLSKLEESISNIYLGTVTIISSLSDGHKELIDMRLNMGRLISANDAQERQAILQHINNNQAEFLKTLITYKEIDDFPLQVEILEHRGLSNLTSYEDSLLTQVNSDWLDYEQARNKVINLSNDGLRENATTYSNTIAADKFSKLARTYNQIVDLNNNLASIMYSESQSVVRQAFLYGIITSVSSAAFAVGAALLISRRMAPSVDKLQQEARKKIDTFISRGSSGKMLTQTTRGEKHEDIETVPISVPVEDKNNKNNELSTDIQLQQQVAELSKKGPMILLHFSQYKEFRDGGRGGGRQPTSDIRDESRTTASVADSLLDYYLTSTTAGTATITTTSVTQTPSSIGGKKSSSLVLITKRSSNLYSVGRKTGASIYILSSSSQDPITTSEDGLLIISINQTSLILEAIKRTLLENPNSVIILDNITELIHKLGFAKVFSLVQSISDEASSYQNSRVIILINENAHAQNEVEAIATICNTFVR
jgi:hypothetical protein